MAKKAIEVGVLTGCLMVGGFLGACGTDDPHGPIGSGSSGKGSEDNAPLDGKYDSFTNPTEHGAIRWGTPQEAAFDPANARFHAWTFSLSGPATVELATKSGLPNMDTVAYLYRRGEGGWGRHVDRADDHGDVLLATLRGELDAGEYRLLVKAYKTQVEGPFSIASSCDGAGCETGGNGELEYEWPAESELTSACVKRIYDVTRSDLHSQDGFSVTIGTRNTVDGVERVAIEAFLRAVSDYEDVSDDDQEIEVESYSFEEGSYVEVTFGADWSYQYLFERDRLLYQYFNDQSPSITYYCGEPGDPAVVPDPQGEGDCAHAMTSYLPGDPDEHTVHEGVDRPGQGSDEVPPIVARAIADYRMRRSVPDAEVTYYYERWQSALGSGETGGEVQVQAEDGPTDRYAVGTSEWSESYLFLMFDDSGAMTVLCQAF